MYEIHALETGSLISDPLLSYRGLISLSHSRVQFVLFNLESVPLIGLLCCADSADLVKTSLLIVTLPLVS